MADNRQLFYNNLIGMGIPPQAALGVLYSLQGESHTSLDPTAIGSGGDFGIAQWTGSRKAGLQAMAKSMGTDATDPNTQWAFMKSELVGPYSHVLQGLQNAHSAADATNIWTSQYESPAVNNWQARYNQGIKTTSLGDNNALVLKGGNAAPIATASTPGTTLNTTAPVAATTPAQQPYSWQNLPKQASQVWSQAHQQQQIQPMQAPNIQPNRPNPAMASQMLAGLQQQDQPKPLSFQKPQGALGQGLTSPLNMDMAAGIYNPYMMMQQGQGYV